MTVNTWSAVPPPGRRTFPPQDWADAQPKHLANFAALLIPDRRERTYPRALKRARHNSYRVKKPDDPGGIRHDRPATIRLHTLESPAA